LGKTKALRFRHVWLWFLILGLLAVLYLPSLKFDLFADDFGFYGRRELGVTLINYFFKGERPGLNPEEYAHFRPLGAYVWALKFALFGERIVYYHAVAILVHLINTVLVFVFARRVLGLDRVWSQCASLLFAVFWFNFESVAWLAANNAAICTAFLLSAVLFSVRYVRQGGIGALLALSPFMLLAIASKEFALVMPLVVGLIWFLPFERPVEGAKKRGLIAVAISVLLVAGYVALRSALAFQMPIVEITPSFLLRTAHGLLTIFWCPLEYRFLGALGALFFLSCLFQPRTRILALLVLVLLAPALVLEPEMRHIYPASFAFALVLVLVLRTFEELPRSRMALLQVGLLLPLAGGTFYAFVKQHGPSPTFVLGGLALALVLLLCLWRRGRLQASSALTFMLVALIAAGNLGLAMDFPWQCRSGAKVMGLGGSPVSQQPEGDVRLVFVEEKSELVRGDKSVPVGSLRNPDFVPIDEMLDNIAECPDTRLDEHVIVIGQTDEKIASRDDIRALLKLRQASYRMPPPDMLSFAFNGTPDQSGRRFAACDIDHKAVGCLEMRDNPLDTVAYDLISVGFLNPNQLPSQLAWLEWYRRGDQNPVGRAVRQIEAGQAAFMLRRQIDWLTAREVTRITTGLVGEDALPYLAAISIRKQPGKRR